MSFIIVFYVEVGIWDDLHVQLFAPHIVGKNSFESGDEYLALGGGDLMAGLQWSSPWIPIPHAVRAVVKVPMYDVARPKGTEATRFPARGDGQVDVDLWLSAGGNLPVVPVYVFAEVGHRFRTEAFVGEGAANREFGETFVVNAQVGVTPFLGVVFAGNMTGVVPYSPGPEDLAKGYVNLGISIYAPIWKGLALEANFDGTVYARNTAEGLSFGFGVSYNLL